MLQTLIGFARPHTVIATSVQVLTILVIVAGTQALQLTSLAVAAVTLLICLALNLYVVGVNQLTDVEIDRVNKPWLPIAAGTLSLQNGQRLVIAAALLALVGAALAGPFLLAMVALIMLIGSLYSLPPLRLKRWPIPAALSIAIARGVISNLGVALHYRYTLGVELPLGTMTMLAVFFFGFALVIAIYKDLPDDAGDRQFQIETFTTRMGPQQVLNLGRVVMSVCYALPIVIALLSLPGFAPLFLLVSHLIVIAIFWWATLRVDLSQQQSITNFYMLLWGLFYAEFALLSLYELARVTT
ncbi:homogentisate phytyltransferase [Candidatus Viridilinea mediisalina]|uniref:Homogentisate phytyltransferase n=1 Tax=Candidatus Viridilinea mediisalina TaxID=2024553 RepID=A0A2A6RLN7_9CHLR|nr:homogentisate phytyltransferase [Candidatus Viridilinea mediisalina]PDW03853.1 homogentisate phytyltransferase [Candidatus Viridilinea mediisalina]